MTLSVNDKEEHFQLDTAATVNVMSGITLSKLCGNADQLESCSTTLLMYNKSEVKPIERKRMRVLNPKNNNMYTVEFIIVKGQCKSFLGLKTCDELELLTKYLTSYFTIDKYTRFVRTRYSQQQLRCFQR